MKVALLGLGTIGSGVKEIIEKLPPEYDVEIVKILDKSSRMEEIGTLFAGCIDDIIFDRKIDVVIEAMGGEKFAYMCISAALKRGKSVITSNKEVVSNHFAEFMALAKENGCKFLFEASVGGGIPIINAIVNNLKFDKIDRIYGILNGTANYILTRMSEGFSKQEALTEAQKLGFAEADPTADIEGLDMVRKIAILSSLAYKCETDVNKIYHSGIANVTKEIIDDVSERGYALKFVAESRLSGNTVFISVEPVLFKKNNPISNVNMEYNSVLIESELNGNLMFYGKGAGKLPTASAIIADLIQICEGKGDIDWSAERTVDIERIKADKYYVVKENGIKEVTENINGEYIFIARIF